MENKYECLSAVSAEKLLSQETQNLSLGTEREND